MFGKTNAGVGSVEDCEKLPEQLQDACRWRFDWFKDAQYPRYVYVRVTFSFRRCSEQLSNVPQRNLQTRRLPKRTHRQDEMHSRRRKSSRRPVVRIDFVITNHRAACRSRHDLCDSTFGIVLVTMLHVTRRLAVPDRQTFQFPVFSTTPAASGSAGVR